MCRYVQVPIRMTSVQRFCTSQGHQTVVGDGVVPNLLLSTVTCDAFDAATSRREPPYAVVSLKIFHHPHHLVPTRYDTDKLCLLEA